MLDIDSVKLHQGKGGCAIYREDTQEVCGIVFPPELAEMVVDKVNAIVIDPQVNDPTDLEWNKKLQILYPRVIDENIRLSKALTLEEEKNKALVGGLEQIRQELKGVQIRKEFTVLGFIGDLDACTFEYDQALKTLTEAQERNNTLLNKTRELQADLALFLMAKRILEKISLAGSLTTIRLSLDEWNKALDSK